MGMRILFDARSVRTAAGLQVLQGLVAGWTQDARISEVIVAVRADFAWSPMGRAVRSVVIPEGGWVKHLCRDVRQIAKHVRADIVFSPNGLQPMHPRAVVYFQDMHHFRRPRGSMSPVRCTLMWGIRRVWQSYSSRAGRLGVCVSEDLLRVASGRLRLPTVMIPNGVELGENWWSGIHAKVFVMGGMGARKSEETALRAWFRIPGAIRARTRMVVGGVEPIERRARLTRLIERIGDGQRVSILGSLNHQEYLRHMTEARLSVSCSRAEAFGLPVAEGLAMGAPVVCSDIPAHLELVDRARAGELFTVGDDQALADALDRALRGQLPRQAAVFPQGWDWNARAREHVDAYERFL
jgi:hypothetical protein